MEHLLPEIHEKILIRSSVRDLIRCKSVCKSWLKLISDPHFTKVHLNHSYHIDRNNDTFGHRRITMSKDFNYLMPRQYDIDVNFFDLIDHHLLGSSNGLVCVSPSPTEVVVINPSTREVNELTKLEIPETESLCWGFGHDSSTDDYKVVLGFRKGKDCTFFQVFSLRFNNWKVLGEVKYVFKSSIGILCKGALHFVAYCTYEKKNIIFSFDLSEERFREVPQPDDWMYQLSFGQDISMRLGAMKDCLCVFIHETLPHELWVMTEYNVKESWEYFGSELDINYDVVHSLKHLKSYIPNKQLLCHEISSQKMWWCQNWVFLGVPLYVESLVSPHFHKQPETERQATSTIKSSKNVVLPPSDFSDSESREKVNNASANTSFDASTSAGV